MAYDYELIHVTVADRVATATIDNPPMNIMTVALARELSHLAQEAAADDDVGALVLRSDDPDFFIAHFDVEAILEFPATGPPERPTEIRGFHRMCETYRTMPKVTIAEIHARAGGGGSELAASCDLRYGALGRTIINQMEVPLGILPGGTGTQRLPRLLGVGRALEVILAGDDLDAERAERWGYLNRALPPEELRPFVDRIARRIASFPPEAVALAKQSVRNAEDLPLRDGLLEESDLFEQTLRADGAHRNMARFLELGGQTRAGETRMGELTAELGGP
jgi:enoyl-CoA hydratase/carnithine racemase